MSAFVPHDDPLTAFEDVQLGEENFLRTADDLSHLPPDLMSPITNYSFYREPTLYLPPPPKHRLQTFQPKSASHDRPLFFSPTVSLSSASPASASSIFSSHAHSVDCTCSPVHAVDLDFVPSQSQSKTSTTFRLSAPLLASPGCHSDTTTSTSTSNPLHLAQYTFPLTPPLDERSPTPSKSYLDWKPCSLSTFASLPLPLLPAPTKPVFDLSPLHRLDLLPSLFPPSPFLQRVLASGLARRQSRHPYLASPALSCSSLPASRLKAPSKSRTSNGGTRSKYSREELACYCSTCNIGIATLLLRGKGSDLNVDYTPHFDCFDCRPDLAGDAQDYEPPHEIKVGYATTLSALLDQKEGLQMQQRRRSIGSTAKVRKAGAGRRDCNLNLVTCKWPISIYLQAVLSHSSSAQAIVAVL